MSIPEQPANPFNLTRRGFVKTTAAATAAVLTPGFLARAAYAGGSDEIKVGVIGCGGRGTGAAANAIEGSANTRIVALADVFSDRLEEARKNLGAIGDRSQVPTSRCYAGFDAYKELLAGPVDLVILATPPHFRHIHLEAAVKAGKHVFMEKPVAVDGPGIRSVIASAELAASNKLAIVAGTQRRHEKSYLEAMQRVRDGALGKIVSARCYWNQGGLWNKDRQPGWSDMEWQLRNWLYFTWLSGDHIVEQHVHNLDVMNWAIGTHPIKALGLGGRQVRTDPAFGHIFDHFAIEYEYPGGVFATSFCRQIAGCDDRVAEAFHGTDGAIHTSPGQAAITGKTSWKFDSEKNNNPYVQEHTDLVKSIMDGKPLNEGRQVAESTLTAIMGRMSTYTGKEVTWEQALNSKARLGPESYVMGSLPVPPVAMPGKTKLE
jgi:myo-inositol 2-dehydrogenase/D-chiro-inositol 1-dehydrogenase